MTGGADTVPLTNRRNLVLSRGLIAFIVVMAVLLAVTLLAEGSGLSPREVLLLVAAVSTPAVAALAWSVVARWGDRVEVWPDRAMRWKGGRLEEFCWRDIATTRAMLGGDGGVFGLDAFGVRVEMHDKRVFSVEGVTQQEAAPLLRAINEEMLGRWFGVLQQSGEVVCPDAARFPWLRATWMAVVAVSALARLFVSDEDTAVVLVRGAMVVASVWWGSWRSVWTWHRARKFGGVRLSAAGIRPMKETAEEALVAAPYRDASAGAVTPWSMVDGASVDGYCMEIRCRDRAEPLVLSSATANLFVAYELMRVMLAGEVLTGPRRRD